MFTVELPSLSGEALRALQQLLKVLLADSVALAGEHHFSVEILDY